jgi:hypothetical protein
LLERCKEYDKVYLVLGLPHIIKELPKPLKHHWQQPNQYWDEQFR